VNAYKAQGKPERAVSRLTALIEQTPDHRFAHELLAEIHISRKQYPEAEKALREAIKANPKWNVPYRNLANLHLVRGDLAAAEETYRQGLQAIPEDTELLLHKAEFHERTRNFKEAIATYERILQKNKNVHVAANNLAALLADQMGDAESLKKAKALAERFESSPQPAFRDTLGWVYYKTGETDKAVSILKDVVKQAPNVFVFRYHLGMAYHKQGNLTDAKVQLAKAIEGKNDFIGKDEARAVFKKIP
jgi:tetratricopeptide (TPR) repeat protein